MSNHDLLLVIDLQNVYTEGQPWACCHIRQAARNIRRLLDAGVCGEVLFTRFVPPAQPEGMWREYNRVNAAVNADAFANAMLPEMAPYLERYPLQISRSIRPFRFRRCGRPRPGPTGWW